MFSQWRFYLSHSWNDLRVNGQRTFFALLCIAAGVAAIVSLQTLALMIQNTLTANLQQSNRGDLQIQPANDDSADAEDALRRAAQDGLLVASEVSFGGFAGVQYTFSEAGYQALAAWVASTYPGSDVTYRQPVASVLALFTGSGQGVAMANPRTGEELAGVYPVMIEADTYPFYSTVVSQEGLPLAQLLNAPTDLVLNDIVAERIGVGVGDTVNVQGIAQPFTVRGVVPTDAEVRNPTQDFLAALNGFYMLDVRSRPLFTDLSFQASNIYVRLPEGADVAQVEKALGEAFGFVRSTTTEDLRRIYTQVSDSVNRLVTVMGLIALLLGSIGIINTMQVIVRRRVLEIAVLKTIGLQASQITVLFLVEAAIMGVIGSVTGVLLGWVLVFAIRGVAEGLLGAELPFVVAPDAVAAGILVGTLVTTVFGFIPTLSAGRIRPAIVLRPDDNLVPRSGIISTLAALGFVMAALSLVTANILGSLPMAVALIIGTFLTAGVLYALLLLTIWLVGRFMPHFGVVDLKVALREMLVTRSRGAITLLALVVGVFSLSLITLLADTASQSISQVVLSDENVLIQVPNEAVLQQVEARIAALEGTSTYTVEYSYNLTPRQLVRADGTALSRDDIQQVLSATDPFAAFIATPAPGTELTQDERRRLESQRTRRLREFEAVVGAVGLVPADPAALPQTMVSGRQFAPGDSGSYIVLTESSPITDLGIQPGDRLVYEYSYGGFLGIGAQTGEVTFEVLGIMAADASLSLGGQSNYVMRESIPADLSPASIQLLANIEPSQISPLRRAISDLPQTFLIETAVFSRLFDALLGQFTAFPLLVALLGLVVGGVVIANSVALSTMERRRQIAVMKSMGLQRERVLAMLLLENAILGLVGGLIGVGLGLAGLLILLQGSSAPIGWPTVFVLMLMCVVIALCAALTTAWGASGEKPLTVLRYE
jgi:ABC-type antimicrobial peptide transport system permease subunit